MGLGCLRSAAASAVLALACLAPAAAETSAGRLGAVAIYVADLEMSSAFYGAALGLQKTGAHETATIAETMMAAPGGEPGATLVLVRPKGEAGSTAPVRLVFFVDDVDGALERLKASGAAGVRPPSKAGNMLIAFARDPDGHLIELIERFAQ